MGQHSEIAWTDSSWSPVRGCSRVSPGCDHCYAMKMAHRFSGPGQPYEGLTRHRTKHQGVDWSGEVRFVEEKLDAPLRWRKPRRVFVNSMSDLFHLKVTDEQIAAVFGVAAACPQHTFQILTKRAERLPVWFAWMARMGVDRAWAWARVCMLRHVEPPRDNYGPQTATPWPLPNVVLGVTCEDQPRADERIPLLLQVPAAKRFVSCEPLLSAIDLSPWLYCQACGYGKEAQLMHGDHRLCGDGVDRPGPTVLDWVIAGCESGPDARPAETSWFRHLRAQCQDAGVPYFLKQRVIDGKLVRLPELDGRVWDQVPG